MTVATLRDRIVASDPGLVRLFMAARATAAVGTALGILLLLRHTFHFPMGVTLMGAALGIMWTLQVSDPKPRDQRITTLLLWLPASTAATIATVTAPNRILSDALFLASLFLSQYVRKYGPRATAMGNVSVFAYFFALFLHVSPRDIGWMVFALAVTAICTYIYRFYVFRDNPGLALRSALAAFAARQRLIAATIAAAAAQGRASARYRRALWHHLFRLNEAALTLDDLLVKPEDRLSVLDAELATGDLVQSAMQDPVHVKVEVRAPEIRGPIRKSVTWTPRGPFRTAATVNTPFVAATTRQAIQIAVAGALSIIAGEFLSTQRWYWAVIATFLVFLGTSSAGETLSQAWLRVLGTALGVVVGMGVGNLVRGHEAAAYCSCAFLPPCTPYASHRAS